MTKDEADSHLRAAIIAHAEAYGTSSEGELLSQWAVVGHWMAPEADGQSRYTTHFEGREIPNHVACGLFRTAERLVWEEAV